MTGHWGHLHQLFIVPFFLGPCSSPALALMHVALEIPTVQCSTGCWVGGRWEVPERPRALLGAQERGDRVIADCQSSLRSCLVPWVP